MIRLAIRAAILLGSSALGLLIAALLVPGFRVSATGFLVAVVVFTAAQAIFSPFIFSIARKHASALLGGIGLVSTFVALLLASLFPGGITVTGIGTWVIATLVVWIVTALGGWLLPLVAFKKKVAGATNSTPAGDGKTK